MGEMRHADADHAADQSYKEYKGQVDPALIQRLHKKILEAMNVPEAITAFMYMLLSRDGKKKEVIDTWNALVDYCKEAGFYDYVLDALHSPAPRSTKKDSDKVKHAPLHVVRPEPVAKPAAPRRHLPPPRPMVDEYEDELEPCFDEDGYLVEDPDSYEGDCYDEEGNRIDEVDEYGDPVEEPEVCVDEEGYEVDCDEVDEYGNPIEPEVCVDEEGYEVDCNEVDDEVDEYGNPIEPEVCVDEEGYEVDCEPCFDEYGYEVEDPDSYEGDCYDEEGNLLGEPLEGEDEPEYDEDDRPVRKTKLRQTPARSRGRSDEREREESEHRREEIMRDLEDRRRQNEQFVHVDRPRDDDEFSDAMDHEEGVVDTYPVPEPSAPYADNEPVRRYSRPPAEAPRAMVVPDDTATETKKAAPSGLFGKVKKLFGFGSYDPEIHDPMINKLIYDLKQYKHDRKKKRQEKKALQRFLRD